MTSIIDEIAKPAINSYLCNKYNLTYEELLHRVSSYFTEKNKDNVVALKYYYDNKQNLEYQDKLKFALCSCYNKNKSKIRAFFS